MRSRSRPRPTRVQTLTPALVNCPICQRRFYADYANFRTVTTLDAVLRLTVHVRRCHNPACSRYRQPYRPEAESHFVLPHHEFGLDVLALVGRLRHAEHRSIPEIHQELCRRGVVLAERTVLNLLDRYDELRALAVAAPQRFRRILEGQRSVVLAIDGLQPDVGHEVLWVLRDCLSGEVLLAKSLLSATTADLAVLLADLRGALPVPITGVVSDGQTTIRQAVSQELPGVPHQLCHFHYLREAARPIYEADRHAKKELKKRVRGVRPLERAAEAEEGDVEAELVRGYCAAVRSALTDDGRPPLVASGLRLHERLEAVVVSLDRVARQAGALPNGLKKLRQLLRRGLEETAALWPPVRVAYRWVKRAAKVLANETQKPAKDVRRRLSRLLSAMRQAAAQTQEQESRQQLHHFVKVTKSYWPGLFRCYASTDIPRTNNDLEHLFGSHRYHERRASGRKVASPSLVVLGSVRVIASLATRLRPNEGLQLPAGYVEQWRTQRAALEKRREARRQRRRFRRTPTAYLHKLEELATQLSLLS
jgi:Transposase, Mutator family